MVFRRHGRKAYSFQARTRTGRQQRATGTSDRVQARAIEAIWEGVAAKHGWDILERVTPAELATLWHECDRDLERIRQRLKDVDLSVYRTPFLDSKKAAVGSNWFAHMVEYLDALFAGAPLTYTMATRALLSQRLSDYTAAPRRGRHLKKKTKRARRVLKEVPARLPVGRETRRKLHSAWSQFFEYCRVIQQAIPSNPMDHVARPKAVRQPPRFYERETVERIIGWCSSEAERAFLALAYGTGIEPTVSLGRYRTDVNPARKEVRAPGTKAHARDRIVRVSGWAWAIFWDYARSLHPAAKLFPEGWNRHTVGRLHESAVIGLNLEPRYPLYCARHHYAATHLRAGVPLAVVQRQLGHQSPMHTLSTYGQFIPSGADRDIADQMLELYERERRGAISGATATPQNEAGDVTSRDGDSWGGIRTLDLVIMSDARPTEPRKAKR